MIFTIKLAEVNIRISSIHEEILSFCKEYLCEEKADFCVAVSQSDIAFEREKAKSEAAYEGRPYADYSDAYLESLAIYRKIAVGLLDYNAFLMHGAVVGLRGKAYLFTAPSGVGKTTHTQYWLETFPDAFIINGDKPLLKYKDGKVYAYGSPWAGKEGRHRNTGLPLCAICALTRGEETSVAPLSFGRIFPVLLEQTYRPAEKESMEKTMDCLARLEQAVSFYSLRCHLDQTSAQIAYEGIHR